MWVQSLGLEDPLEKEMATHSCILAWKNPMDRGIWQSTVHEVVKSWTWLSTCQQNWYRLTFHLNYVLIANSIFNFLNVLLSFIHWQVVPVSNWHNRATKCGIILQKNKKTKKTKNLVIERLRDPNKINQRAELEIF